MHPLRVLLLVSVAIAVAVGSGLAWALTRAGAATPQAALLGVAAFAAFMLPWAGVSLWAYRRASDLDLLTDRTRAIASDAAAAPITDREYHGEVDDLARAVEEMRLAVLREKAWSEEQRSTMEQISASLGEGMLALSARGRIVLANDRVRQMFGVSGELVGRPLIEVVRNQALSTAFARALQGHPSSDRVTTGSGEGQRVIEIRVVPVVTSTEVAAVALFIDISAIERLQRVRKEFLDDFSHEVRTPLAGLRSAVETFDQGRLTAEQEGQLRSVMLRQLTRIERLVSDLSELNRIESGDLVLQRREVDLLPTLRDLAQEFDERYAGSVRFVVSGSPATASADLTRVQQIFSNLLDNAAKHGGEGEVGIDVAREESAAVVRVSDRGEGIPPTDVDRIFNRFYRVDKSRSQSVPGIGLGLAIAKHLVLLHGGTIRASNRQGGGATFEVRLPAGQGPPPA